MDSRHTEATMTEYAGYESQSGLRYLAFDAPSGDTSDAVVVYLHGVGERGDDLAWVKRYGLPALIAEGRATLSARLVCPQLEADADWHAGRVAAFVRAMHRPPSRVALIGYSLGASGVCQTLSCHGAVADIAVAIAGQAPAQAKVAQQGVTLLAIQGALDPWPDTEAFAASVCSKGGLATRVTLPGLGHYVSEEAVLHPACRALLHAVGIDITLRHRPSCMD